MFQLAAPASAEIEIRKSRFIGMLFAVGSRAEAQQLLAAVYAEAVTLVLRMKLS